MRFSHYVRSYLIFLRNRIKFLKLFRRTYKNSISTIIHTLRKKYPFEGILKNGTVCKYYNFSEIYYALMNIDYNNKEDSIITSVKNSSKKVKLIGVGNSADIPGIFLEGDYDFLPAKDNVVIDIGSNVGDSSIYFCLKGAKKVIALDPYPPNYEIAKKNIEKNDYSDKIVILLAGCSNKAGNISSENKENKNFQNIPLLTLEEIMKSQNIESSILKMDCEGCEYDTILQTPCEILRKFTHIQIEYHYGYKNLQKKLEKCGFKVSISPPKYFRAFNVNNTTVSIFKEQNSSKYIMSQKPKNPKMYIGWIYAVRN